MYFEVRLNQYLGPSTHADAHNDRISVYTRYKLIYYIITIDELKTQELP